MHRPMLAGLCALALSGCAASTRSMPSLPAIPHPPAAALVPCPTPAVPRQADGAATSADAEAGLRERGIALAQCEAKRRLLVDAWPR